MIQGRLFDKDFFISKQDLLILKLFAGMLQDYFFAFLFEVLFCFVFDKAVVVEDVLLELEELLYELFERTTIDVAQFSDYYRV
jgi:hypothetical protein